jgi:hypothetical protein
MEEINRQQVAVLDAFGPIDFPAGAAASEILIGGSDPH